MPNFLSCDWGTSSFRLRLADTGSGKVLCEEKSAQGTAATFNDWQEIGNADNQKRVDFYLAIIRTKAGYIRNGLIFHRVY
jgi:2-dehydro-3-deoxygalactonokinase